MFLKLFGDIPEMLVHQFQIILIFLCLCQSVCWLTLLLKSDKYRDISKSGGYIFLECFRDNPGIFLDFFQIILNFLYVCQSVSWLTSLLKSYKYRDISSSGRDIFLIFSGDIPRINPHLFQIILNFLYVSQSDSWLTSLLKLDKYRDISSFG